MVVVSRVGEAWREATSFMRLMVASILSVMSGLVVFGLANPTVVGVVASIVLVPLALVSMMSWFGLRPAATGAEAEHAIRGFGMWFAFIVLLVILVPTVVFILAAAVALIVGSK